MATKEQVRGAILAKRIKTINNFLLDKIGTQTTFGDYLKSLGIDEKTFMKELPPYLSIDGISNATPDSENLLDYGALLNYHLHHQKLLFEADKNQTLSADAINNLSSAVVPANWIDYNADAKPKSKPYGTDSKGHLYLHASATPKYYGTDKKGHLLHSANAKPGKPKPKPTFVPFNAVGDVVNLVDASNYEKVVNPNNPHGRYISGLTPYDGRDSSYTADGYYNAKGKGLFGGKVKKAIKKATEDVKKAIKDTGKAIEKAGKDLSHAVKHPKELLHGFNAINPVTVVMRGSFLSLLALNIAGLASALKAIKNDKDQSHWKKFLAKWNALGGDTQKLKSTIDNGSVKKPFPPLKKSQNADGNSEDIDVNNPANSGKVALKSAGALGGLAAVLAANPATSPAAVYVGSASGILAALQPILKAFAKAKGEDSSLVADIPEDSKLDDDTKKALKDIQDGKDIEDFTPTFWDSYKAWIIGIIGFGTLATIVALSSGDKK